MQKAPAPAPSAWTRKYTTSHAGSHRPGLCSVLCLTNYNPGILPPNWLCHVCKRLTPKAESGMTGKPHHPKQPVQRLPMWQEVNKDQGDCTSLLPLQKLLILTRWAKDEAWQYLLPSDITALNIKHFPQTYSGPYIDYKMQKAEMRYS